MGEEVPLRENNYSRNGSEGSENVEVEETVENDSVVGFRGCSINVGDLEIRKDSLTLILIVGLIAYEVIEK